MWTVVITLVLYKLVLLGIGLLAQRRTRDADDFYLGGRRLGPWVAALSASASSSSAWTLLGVSGAAYAWGLPALWIFPACILGFLFNWYVLAPRVQRLSHREGALTATDLVAPRGQPGSAPVRLLFAGIVLFSFTVYVASQFQGAGKTFHETFQLGTTESILLGGVIIGIYTLLGGFWAVSLTDTLQGLAMGLAAVLVPAAVIVAVGGPIGLIEGMQRVEMAGWMDWTRGTGPAAVGFVAGTLGIGLGYPGQPHVVTRFMALEERENAIRVARRVAIGWAVLVYAGMLVVGWAGRVYFGVLADEEVLFVHATNALLPGPVAGVMLAAVLSAIMSTADSQLLVAASAVTHDVGLGRGTRALLASRLTVVGISLAAVLLAVFGSKEIFGQVLFAWGAVGSALGPPLIATVLVRRPPALATGLAMVVGFTLAVVTYSLPATKGTAFERVLPFVIGAAIVAAGLAIHRASDSKNAR